MNPTFSSELATTPSPSPRVFRPPLVCHLAAPSRLGWSICLAHLRSPLPFQLASTLFPIGSLPSGALTLLPGAVPNHLAPSSKFNPYFFSFLFFHHVRTMFRILLSPPSSK